MSIYDDPLITYNGQPTDAFFSQMNSKVDELHGRLGLNAGPSEADIAAPVLAALNATTIPVDAKKMNGATIIGDGSIADPWRGVGVQV